MSFLTHSLNQLSKRFSRSLVIGNSSSAVTPFALAPHWAAASVLPGYRSFGSKKKTTKISKNKMKAIKKQSRKQAAARKAQEQLEQQQTILGEDGIPIPYKPKKPEATLQHQQWVDFQKSIAVPGFQTGQILVARTDFRRRRGGAAARRQAEKERAIAEQTDWRFKDAALGVGRVPTMRYSEEETERLLELAHAAIPARTGKRGTRNMLRQKRRWWLVREIHRTYKKHMQRFQLRKMIIRSEKIKKVKAVLQAAPSIREQDRSYQMEVYQRYWAANLTADAHSSSSSLSSGNRQSSIEM
jgi:hypothetical protein